MIVDKACFERGCACYDDRVDGPGVEVVEKEWVGLTDEEVRECYGHVEGVTVSESVILMSVVRTTQAALKEKNT